MPFDRTKVPGGPSSQRLVKVTPRRKGEPRPAPPKPPARPPVRTGRKRTPGPKKVKKARRNDATGLARVEKPGVAFELAHLIERAQEYAGHAKSAATRRAYTSDWKSFAAFAIAAGAKPLPAPEGLVALYLTHLADTGHATATIERHLVAIAQVHKAAGHPSPRLEGRVQEVRKGIRRRLGVRQVQKDPVLIDILREMLKAQPDDLIGIRNRAVLTLGFAMGSRRSELVGLDVDDLKFVKEGLVVTIKRSKTDQEGAGRQVPITPAKDKDLDSIHAVKAWLEESGIENGALFRSVRGGPIGGQMSAARRIGKQRLNDRSVALIVKSAIEACKCGNPKNYSGHSLRAGLVTEAARAGKSMIGIKRQTGHKSDRMVEKYIREAELFNDAGALVGLF